MALTALNRVLQTQLDALRPMATVTFQGAGAAIFRQQIGDPVRQLIDELQAKLTPFTDALVAIKQIVDTVLTLPAKIDQIVANVLATTQASLGDVITQIISTVASFGTAITHTLQTVYNQVKHNVDQLSPAWLLNSFAASDFVPDPATPSSGSPAGLLRMAERIVNGTDEGDLRLAARLQATLSADELAVLQAGLAGVQQEPTAPLVPGARSNVIKALNAALRDPQLAGADTLGVIKTALTDQMQGLQTQIDTEANAPDTPVEQRIATIKQLYRLNGLARQITSAEITYLRYGQTPQLLRLNRALLEASYSDALAMSLPSLHPYIVEQVAHLYPASTVQRLDEMYTGVVDKIKQLPDQLIRAPLDDTFNEIKLMLKQNFDVSSIFVVLELKLDGMDEDLAAGLDRLSEAYHHLLVTFDQRLAATG